MAPLVIVSLAFVLILLIYGIYVYNKLVKLKILVQEAWSGIDVMLRKRHDLIPSIVDAVKGYATHERSTLENVTEARAQATAANGIKETENAENNLSLAVSGLMVVAEQYPELKANTNFLQLQEELANVEGDIEKSRRYYNGTVRNNNVLVESFPSNIIAGIFGFVKSAFFELRSTSEREVPKVSF